MNPPDSPSPLSRTLAEWRLTPGRDPRFRARVWERITAARTGVSWPAYVRTHGAALAGALALALALGAWVGREQARARVAADRAEIVSAYVQALDARTMSMP